MTGFGKATGAYGNRKISVEVRSLNSKQLDLNLRLPSMFKEKEMELKSKIATEVERGKVDVSIYYENFGEEKNYSINTALAESYYNDLRGLCDKLQLKEGEILSTLMRLPEVVSSERKEFDEKEWSVIAELCQNAIENFKSFRKSEGEKLFEDLRGRVALIEKLLIDTEPFDKERMEGVRSRLDRSLQEYLGSENIDKNRFEQELIYYMERLDVSEEKVRLRSHCGYFVETMEKEHHQGRKLGFISQEMGREINTLGSKSNHAGMQKIVVLMKDELEKIKEQVLNVL
ncbi:MAG: YicC family protein [Flavobacteriales bacterium]|nr:YicC family protein [Flavobacteriales bacterium]